MKNKILLLIGIFFLVSCFSAIAEEHNVEVHVFYGQGCPHCSKLNLFLDDLQDKYPNLEVKNFEVYQNEENRELFEKMTEVFGSYIQELGLFGVSVSFAPSKKELNGLVRNFPEALDNLLILK